MNPWRFLSAALVHLSSLAAYLIGNIVVTWRVVSMPDVVLWCLVKFVRLYVCILVVILVFTSTFSLGVEAPLVSQNNTSNYNLLLAGNLNSAATIICKYRKVLWLLDGIVKCLF